MEVLSPVTFKFWFAYQLNVTFVLATRFKLTAVPLHTVSVSSFNKANGGFTVTAIVCEEPVQFPLTETGVTL